MTGFVLVFYSAVGISFAVPETIWFADKAACLEAQKTLEVFTKPAYSFCIDQRTGKKV